MVSLSIYTKIQRVFFCYSVLKHTFTKSCQPQSCHVISSTDTYLLPSFLPSSSDRSHIKVHLKVGVQVGLPLGTLDLIWSLNKEEPRSNDSKILDTDRQEPLPIGTPVQWWYLRPTDT